VTLRVAFAGTSDFALAPLRACAAACDVALVITRPDKPGNRGKLTSPPVAVCAREMGLELFQPRRIRDADSVANILGHNIDALVVASYGQIIPDALLDGPRFGGINVHPSLLPRWRGASPVVAAILAGDEVTGVCIMKMDAGMDTGPVYSRRERRIGPRETASELLNDLSAEGAEMLTDVLAGIEAGTATPVEQEEAGVTIAPLLTREMGTVVWAQVDAVQVDRMVRALNPWPGVIASVKGRQVRILGGEPLAASLGEPGEILAQDTESVVIGTRSGGYRLLEVQPPGKRPMPAAAFLRGVR
jgi:methionyl-tRNA formyltransferase